MPSVSFRNKPPRYLFRNMPSASNMQGQTVYISDVGVNGSYWFSNGNVWNPVGGEYILKSENSTIVSDGTTTESILSQVFIPANLLQAGDVIEMDTHFEKSSTVDTSTHRYRIGTTGTVSDSIAVTIAQPSVANRVLRQSHHFKINNSTTVRPASAPGAATVGASTATTALITVGVDFTQDSYFSFTTQMTTGGIETIALRKIMYKHITARV